jgi:hypothetical protein
MVHCVFVCAFGTMEVFGWPAATPRDVQKIRVLIDKLELPIWGDRI